MGWGYIEGSVLPKELQELQVPLVTLETCQRTYGWLKAHGENGTRVNESLVVTDSMICAGGLNRSGACQYDSGKSR